MTKKEQENLHSKKCTVQAVETNLGRGLENRYLVAFSLTAGELIGLNNSLIETEGRSAVQDDIQAFLRNALERAEIKI